MTGEWDDRFDQAAEWIRAADGLLIGAGAGMGVDSGLPDFRGNEGFWNAYPAFRDQRLSFVDMANPQWFRSAPRQAWGFYGHRLQMYRSTQPHAGFACLLKWCASVPLGGFVFTSNVDGHFQQAGFDDERILECHGSIHYLQCTEPCSSDVWPSDPVQLAIDTEHCLAEGELPRCRRCNQIARPNILMFGDGQWVDERALHQEQHLQTWLATLAGKRIVAIECGAGTAVPTVRSFCQRYATHLIRINPREPNTPPGGLSIPTAALQAIRAIDQRL